MNGYSSRLLSLLPTTLTLGNLLCGFFALVLLAFWDSPQRTTAAGWLIVVGLALDGLDGAAARRLNLTTRLGAVLDSLADLVSFGMAPCMLVMALWIGRVGSLSAPVAASAAWLLAATALRLARVTFPAEPGQWDSRFFGLPCGASGLTVASFALLPAGTPTEQVLLGLPAGAILLGALMLSGVVYHRPAELFKGMRYRWAKASAAVLACLGLWAFGGYALLAVCVLFIVSPLGARASRSAATRGSLSK